MGTVPQPHPSRVKRSSYLLLMLLPLVGAALIPTVSNHLRAASLLLRIENADDHSRLARYHTYAVNEESSQLSTPSGMVRARTYTPVGASNPASMVVVHGVHHLGVNETRLMAFSRALSASGIRVFTPELPDITDYRISRASVDVIGAAVQHFSEVTGRRVGVLGISFAGGESLLTAADPRYANSIGFVVSVGSHDDMRRVADFFVTGKIARPDGSVVTMKPHEYGPLVLLYSHPEEFFPAEDLPRVRNALRLLLWEQVEDSKRAAKGLSPATMSKMNAIYQHDDSVVMADLRTAIPRHAQEMAAVSPHNQLARLHVPVLLLHGSGDDVIPATEMLWLEKDVPHEYLRGALVTPLLTHVSVAGEPPMHDKLVLVHFVAQLLELADESRSPSLAATN